MCSGSVVYLWAKRTPRLRAFQVICSAKASAACRREIFSPSTTQPLTGPQATKEERAKQLPRPLRTKEHPYSAQGLRRERDEAASYSSHVTNASAREAS